MKNQPSTIPDPEQLHLVGLSSRAAIDAQLILAIDNAARHEMLARSHSQRRSEVTGSRDNRVFRLGAAFETNDALDLCDIALVGVLKDPIAMGWLHEAAATHDGGWGSEPCNFVDCLRSVLSDEARREYLVYRGIWVRWKFLAHAYHADVAVFEAGKHGQDPAARWRFGKTTYRQRYLVEMISRLLASSDPEFSRPELLNAGQTHDWLRSVGGNPRFSAPPSPPVLPTPQLLRREGDR